MNSMLRFWLLLCLYLTLGAGPGEEDDGGEDVDGGGDDDAGGEDNDDDAGLSLDDMLGSGDEPPKKKAPAEDEEETPREKQARIRAAQLEQDLETERVARRRAEAERAPAAARTDPDQALYDAEEARLAAARAAGKTPEEIGWLQWQIDSSRNIRKTERNSNQALFAASDIADKAAFDRLEATKPKTHKRYAKRVEEELAKTRAAGNNPPRVAILRYLIGNDFMEDKIKTKAGKTKEAAAPGVDRGRTPGARNDVAGRGKGGSTERDKRRARLQNTPI